MFEHFIAIRQQEAYERLWALRTSAYPQCDKKEARKIHASAAEISDVGKRKKSAVELMDDPQKVRMIGGMLKKVGQPWARKNRPLLDWLARQGLTEADAVSMHEQHYSQMKGEAFWAGRAYKPVRS